MSEPTKIQVWEITHDLFISEVNGAFYVSDKNPERLAIWFKTSEPSLKPLTRENVRRYLGTGEKLMRDVLEEYFAEALLGDFYFQRLATRDFQLVEKVGKFLFPILENEMRSRIVDVPKIELKPCPICGARANIFYGTKKWNIMCPNCDTWGPLVAIQDKNTINEAVNAWNQQIVEDIENEFPELKKPWKNFGDFQDWKI